MNYNLLACPYCHSNIINNACSNCNETFENNNGQLDLRIKRDIQIPINYNYRPEFGYFPWDKVVLEWPNAANRLTDFSNENFMLKSVPLAKKSMAVLDIGCGVNEQRFKEGLRNLGYDTTGFDISGNAPDVLGDAHCLPFKDASFDLIISYSVFEHLKNPFVAINEMYRVAKPGALIVQQIAFCEPFHISYFHHSPLAVHELMASVGFEPETFVLSDGYNAFYAHLNMGFAGAKIPGFMKHFISRVFMAYAELPSRIKSIIKRDRNEYIKGKIAFARSHSASIGVIARKPL